MQCTIYQPTTLGSAGCLNPVIVWGNGTVNTPSSYDALFKHLASHGFIIAAADTSNSGSGMEMLACLSYILAQNTASGSALAGHIDVNHIASSGYSQGGAGCLAAGEDPRFVTVLAVSPYIVISLGSYDPSMDAAKQTHPLFMISGGADTIATPNNNQQPIFDTAPVPLFWGTHAGSSHLEVLGAGGAYAGPMTAWFRWKLMGDPAAREVVREAGLHAVQRRRLDRADQQDVDVITKREARRGERSNVRRVSPPTLVCQPAVEGFDDPISAGRSSTGWDDQPSPRGSRGLHSHGCPGPMSRRRKSPTRWRAERLTERRARHEREGRPGVPIGHHGLMGRGTYDDHHHPC